MRLAHVFSQFRRFGWDLVTTNRSKPEKPRRKSAGVDEHARFEIVSCRVADNSQGKKAVALSEVHQIASVLGPRSSLHDSIVPPRSARLQSGFYDSRELFEIGASWALSLHWALHAGLRTALHRALHSEWLPSSMDGAIEPLDHRSGEGERP